MVRLMPPGRRTHLDDGQVYIWPKQSYAAVTASKSNTSCRTRDCDASNLAAIYWRLRIRPERTGLDVSIDSAICHCRSEEATMLSEFAQILGLGNPLAAEMPGPGGIPASIAWKFPAIRPENLLIQDHLLSLRKRWVSLSEQCGRSVERNRHPVLSD